MINFKFKRLAGITLIVLSLPLLISCDRDDDANLGPIKMFTPGTVNTQGFDNEARLTWDPSLFTGNIGETYTAQVSLDSLFTNEAEIILEKQTDTTGIVFTDAELEVRKTYFARIKANAYEDRPESNWTPGYSFRIRGIQILYDVYAPEVGANSATIRWMPRDGVSSVSIQEFTQEAGEERVLVGDPIDVSVTPAEAAEGVKLLTDLSPETKYQIDLYQGSISVGYRAFTTSKISIYTTTLSPGDDLSDAIDASVDGDVIALNPGSYDESDSNFNITGKSISIVSTSSNPRDTKVMFKEFTLNGDGAGITIDGIELDGSNGALYLINLTGGETNFGNVRFNNSIIHDVSTSAFRANRGPNSGYFMDSFTIDYSLIYNISPSNYGFLHLDELIFNEINITNSTIYTSADLLIRRRQSLDAPGPTPIVLIDYCTINSIGSSSNYTLYDGGSVDVNLIITNSIIANIPLPGSTVGESLLRLDGSGSSARIANNNFFNLKNSSEADAVDLTIPEQPYITVENIFRINLGWDGTTTNFTVSQNPGLQSASSVGGLIGDPRWWFN